MGLLHFARRDVGAVVLEVGMGGRLDSTNVVHPLVSIITSISFDHTRQLGNTLAAIATEKAGILKRGRPAVSGVRAGEAQRSIRRMAALRRCRLHELGTDFGFDAIPPEQPVTRPTPFRVAAWTWRTDWGTLHLPAAGPAPGPQCGGRPGGLRRPGRGAADGWRSAATTWPGPSPS